MKILFLPNFRVTQLTNDNPDIPVPNKIVFGQGYWFFKGFPKIEIKIIDNYSFFPFNIISRILKIEIIQAIRAIIHQKHYDVIVSHSYNSGFIFSVVRSLFNINTPPHIVIDVGCLNGAKDKKWQISLLKFSLKSINALIYHSRINERFYSTRFPKIKREFIPFGIDTDFFKPFDNPPQNDYALCIGYAKRDFSTLVDAWENIQFPLKIVGINPNNQQWCKKNYIECILFKPITSLKEYIYNARFIILPIENEQYSVGQMTFLQSMSMGKIVIVNNVPGVSDYFKKNCIPIEYKNKVQMIDTIKKILTEKNLDELEKRARNSVIENFTEMEMGKRICDFIELRYYEMNT